MKNIIFVTGGINSGKSSIVELLKSNGIPELSINEDQSIAGYSKTLDFKSLTETQRKDCFSDIGTYEFYNKLISYSSYNNIVTEWNNYAAQIPVTFNLIEIVIYRDPRVSWLLNYNITTFDDFLTRYKNRLKNYKIESIIKFEDFINDYKQILEKIFSNYEDITIDTSTVSLPSEKYNRYLTVFDILRARNVISTKRDEMIEQFKIIEDRLSEDLIFLNYDPELNIDDILL